MQSSGDDEAAQRADALRVEDYKPFAVLETTPTGLDVLTTKVAQDGYVVMSNTTTTDKALKQQPYRWGQADQVADAVNAGEFVGKQLVGKKAEYAGSADFKKTNRTIGVLYPPAVFDVKKWFVPQVEKQGGKIAPNAILEYTSNGTTVGDPTTAQEQAPTLVAKLKDLGITSVVMFTDVEMGKAVTAQATKLEYQPEWIIAGYQYQDLALLARTYDQDQWAHAFGISNLFPYVKPADPNAPTALDAVQWYYGRGNGTSSVPGGAYVAWVDGRHPVRRSEPHAENVPPRTVLRARSRRCGVGPPHRLPDRIRQDGGAPLRRVPGTRHGLRSGLVGLGDPGRVLADLPQPGAGRRVVRRRGEALQGRHLADQTHDVLRQDHGDPGVPDVAGAGFPTQPVHRMSERRCPGHAGRGVNDLGSR